MANVTWPIVITGLPLLDGFLCIFAICFLLINFIAVYAGVSTYAERKIAGHMQARVGPYRIWWHGFGVWIADALKLMIKEDIIAKDTDRLLFKLSPYVVFAGSFACWVALPFIPGWSPAHFNIGILYLLAVSSAVVIGILMAGWSSGSKWALFGAMRSAAQIVSYEVPIGITLLGMLLIYGTLDMQAISAAQDRGLPFGLLPDRQGGLLSWGINRYGPFTVIAFVTTSEYVDSSVVEGDTYFYAVRALDTSFNRSTYSAQVEATAQARTVTLVFNVTVPASTDGTGRPVSIAGTLSRLDGDMSDWTPSVTLLSRTDATHWTIQLSGLEGTQIEYKYQLQNAVGDGWLYVEKDASCAEVSNRQLTLAYGATGTQNVNDTVVNWRNVAPCGN